MIRFIANTIGVGRRGCQAALMLMILILFQGSADPGRSISRKKIAQRIQKILSASYLKKTDIGVKIVSLKDNRLIFSYDENKLLKPASNVKLVTTLAALKYLGTDYTFKTKIYTDGKIRGNTLYGNLYIKGFGDPKLVSEQVWFLTNELTRHRFKKVTGDLIIDETFFDDKRVVKNGSGRRRQRAYDALLGALSVNFNTTTVYVAPGRKVGAKPWVTIDPDNDYIKVINKATTVAARKRMTVVVSRTPGQQSDTVVVTGGMPLGKKERRFYRNVSYPQHYAASFFRRFLKERGIVIQGKNRFEAVPKRARELLVYESRPLRILVSDLNRISNNFVAEQILKTIAGELKGPPGTTDKGLEILREFLRGLGIKDHFRLVNGSGFSTHNLMTAAQLVEVLKYGYGHFEVFPEYVGSMGIVGVDGTVETRLKSTVAQGRIRAKTGSMRGVTTLSGYVHTLNNETLAFSMLMNDPKNRAQLMQKIQDDILLLLCHLE